MFTKIAVAGGIAVLAFMFFLALIGFRVVGQGLVVLVVLVALIAGGNLLSARGSTGRRRPEPEPRPLRDVEPGGETDGDTGGAEPTSRRPAGPEDAGA